MKSHELFSVAVKCVGLYFLVQGIYRLLQVVDLTSPVMSRTFSHVFVTMGGFLFSAAIHFAISVLFLKRTQWLVEFAYPGLRSQGEPKVRTAHEA